jgi:WD40 repeat protein
MIHERDDNSSIGIMPQYPIVKVIPDTPIVASTSPYSKTIKLWNTTNGKLLHTLTHSDRVTGMAICPQSQSIASHSYDGNVRVWDTKTGKQLHLLKGILVSNLLDIGYEKFLDMRKGFRGDFTGDCQIIASVIERKTDGVILSAGWHLEKEIKLWNVKSGALVHTFQGKKDNFIVIFSPDRRTMASASEDGMVKLWDITDRLSKRTNQPKLINSLDRFSRFGTWFVENDNLDYLLKDSCNWVRNYLRYSQDIKEDSDRHLCNDVHK